MFFAIVLMFGGFVGEGGGAAYEPGADTMRALIFERSIGHAALGCAGIGVIVLLASVFVPARRES